MNHAVAQDLHHPPLDPLGPHAAAPGGAGIDVAGRSPVAQDVRHIPGLRLHLQ